MALGLNTQPGEGGGFPEICKYNAQSGMMFRRDRFNDGSGWVSEDVDITRIFKGVFDMPNIKVGWRAWVNNRPESHFVPLGANAGPKPSPAHKEATQLTIVLTKEAAGTDSGGKPNAAVRELTIDAKVVNASIDALHDAYVEGVKNNPGKLPVVIIKGTKKVETGGGPGRQKSSHFPPIFEIVGWVPVPDVLKSKATPAPAAAVATAQKAGGAPPWDTPQAEMADAEDFG